MSTLVKLPIVMFTDETWTESFYYESAPGIPIDITGYTAKMQARRTANSSDPAFLSVSTSDYITITGTLGLVLVSIPRSVTVALPLVEEAVWDLFIYGPGGNPAIRLVGGPIAVRESVTR